MATASFVGTSLGSYKSIVISPGVNSELLEGKVFKIGLGSYLLTFAEYNASDIATEWNASTNQMLRQITASADGDTLTFTHNTLGQDFELTVLVDGEQAIVVSAKQRIIFSPTPAGGTFTLNDGVTSSGNITWSSTANTLKTNVQNALLGMGYAAEDITVTIESGDVVLDFSTGSYAGLEVSPWTGTFTSLTGGNANVVVATTQQGNEGTQADYNISYPAAGTHDEVLPTIQEIDVDAESGTFTLEVDGYGVTTAIPFDAGRSVVKTKLESVVGRGNVLVTGGPLSVYNPEYSRTQLSITNVGQYDDDALLTESGTDFRLGGNGSGAQYGVLVRAVVPYSAPEDVPVTLLRVVKSNIGTLGDGTEVGVTVQATDSTNPPAWPANYAALTSLSGLGYTTANADFVPEIDSSDLQGVPYEADVTDIIKEIVGTGGWVANRAIYFWLQPSNNLRGIDIATDAHTTLAAPSLYSDTTLNEYDHNTITVQFTGNLATTVIPEMAVNDDTDGTVTVTVSQVGGLDTVDNITGGSQVIRVTHPTTGSVSFYFAWNADATTVETAISAIFPCTVTGGPSPDNAFNIVFDESEDITVEVLPSFTGNFDGAVNTVDVRDADPHFTPENIWDLTICPGEDTLGVLDDDPLAYIILRISEPITGDPVISFTDTENDIRIKLAGINADRIEDAINEHYGKDVVRVTRVSHSNEHDNVLVGSGYGTDVQEPVYFWFYKDVYRLFFFGDFADSASVTSITVTTPPTSEENPEPAGPDLWLKDPVGIPASGDVADAYYESDKVYYGFVNRMTTENPVHLFSAERYTESVDPVLSYRIKLAGQYPVGNTIEQTRTGIARALTDQTVTLSWVRKTYGAGEEHTTTTLASTSFPWNASAVQIASALEGIFGVGNVEVEGSLYNSYLSETLRDEPDEEDSYNELLVRIVGALAYQPLNESDYELTASISNVLAANNAQSKAFKCVTDKYTVPLPKYITSRKRFTLSNIDDIDHLLFSINNSVVELSPEDTLTQWQTAINTALAGSVPVANVPLAYSRSVAVYGSSLDDSFDIEITGNGYQYDPFVSYSITAVYTATVITTVTQNVAGVAPRPEIQTYTITGAPRSGDFTLEYADGDSDPITVPATNTVLVREAIENVAAFTGNVTVAINGAVITATFDSSLGNIGAPTVSHTMVNASGSITVTKAGGTDSFLSIYEATRGKGPLYFDDPDNYVDGVVPSSNDRVVVEDCTNAISFGIEQHAEFKVVSLADNTFRYTRLRNTFLDGQIVAFTGTGTAPDGMTFSDLPDTPTYYEISDASNDFTFKLKDPETGDYIEPADVGSGTFYLTLINIELDVYSRFTGASIGLPNRRDSLKEYLPCYLTIGQLTAEIGIDEGPGVSLLRLDTLDTASTILIRDSASSSVPNIPAVTLLTNNENTTLTIQSGEVGVGVYDEEAGCVLKSVHITGGSLYMNNVTVIDPIDAADVDVRLRNCTIQSEASL